MLLYFLYCVRCLVFRSFLFVWLLSFLMNKDIYIYINRRLQISISENDIEIAHQLSNRKPTGDATQGQQLQEPVIIARFRDQNIRDSVIRECRS